MIADNQVIQQIDIQNLPGFYKLLCHGNIFWRRCGISAGMVVADDNAGAVANDGGAKYFSGA